MKESLRLLGVNESGLKDLHIKKLDEDIYNEAKEISNLEEKIKFLKGYAGEKSTGNPKSKSYLASLIIKDDIQLACDLAFSVCNCSPSSPEHYLLFAEIAYEHKAWNVAKSGLEVSLWLSTEKDKEILSKSKTLLGEVIKKIENNETDNSTNQFWLNKPVEKYWVLERLYYQGKVDKVINLSFKLLDMYSKDLNSYEAVFKIFSLIENNKALEKFAKYILNSANLDEINKNLYTGMTYFSINEYDFSMEYLQKVANADPKNTKAKYYLSLIYLFKQQLKDFVIVFNKMLPGSESSYVALYFIYCAISDFKLDEIEFPDQKNISVHVSEMIKKLIKNNQPEMVNHLMNQFKKLNYNIILPYLNLYLAELFIKENQLDRAKKLLENCKDEEVHRLLAWIYRLEGNTEQAEKELMIYRKSWIPEKEKGVSCKPVPLNVPEIIPEKLGDVFKTVSDLFNQTKDLINQFDMEYGLNSMTCIEATCQDCCRKTFPYMSFIEYLYLKNFLETQSEEFRNLVHKKSIEIVNDYKKKYKKDPTLVLGGREEAQKEYPGDFQFDCPCLGDNSCNVYEGRPYTCRAYGFGSVDGTRYKGCSYFFEQFKGATKLHAVRKVLDMNSFMKYTSKVDEKLIGKHVIAPIPVWLASTHEENLEKIKNL